MGVFKEWKNFFLAEMYCRKNGSGHVPFFLVLEHLKLYNIVGKMAVVMCHFFW